MNHVVITGGAGFIGTALANALISDGFEPLVLDTKARISAASSMLKGVSTAVLDFPNVKGISEHLCGAKGLYHLACTTNPSESMKSMVYDAETNIIPSLILFETAAKAGIKSVIFASSGGTIYGTPQNLPVSEDEKKDPLCAYGVSKLTLERYLDLYGRIAGIKTISLRSGNPYGPFQLRGTAIGVIARYLSLVAVDKPLEVWGDGSIIRDYIWIEDVAKAFVLALQENFPAGAYNISSGSGLCINDIITLIFQITGKKVPLSYLPMRDFDVPNIVLDSSRFRKLTGWQPQTLIEEGIQRMWQACIG